LKQEFAVIDVIYYEKGDNMAGSHPREKGDRRAKYYSLKKKNRKRIESSGEGGARSRFIT